MPVEKPKYDFYENALFLDDPIQADLNRKNRTCAPKIGTEPRVSIKEMDFSSRKMVYEPEPEQLAPQIWISICVEFLLCLFSVTDHAVACPSRFPICADATEQLGAEPRTAVLPQG